MRVLLVEDDTMIGESVRIGLRHDGFAVDWVQDGKAAEFALKSESYALLLLDLGVPKKNGLDVLRDLRAGHNPISVLVLTARDAIADRVIGLDCGADDYLAKPFDLDELTARIRALIRRQSGRSETVMRFAELTLNPTTHQARIGDKDIPLSAKEFALLEALIDRAGAILSRAQLEQRLYGWNEEVDSNAVEVHIYNLRKKLGRDLIRNVRGIGYMLAKS
ncbi:MAG: winged helix-turn-helix domain-containing protein [Pseudomonadota bacterium]|nr:winged helix-turn-helix domain-containing protein [Pseudomonadota bacterium]